MTSFAEKLVLTAGQHAFLAYGIIYIVTIFFGNISAFVNAWIAFTGGAPIFTILTLFIVVLLALTTGDCMWYTLGNVLRDTKLGDWVKRRLPGYVKAEALLEKRGKRFLYFSKFAYGSAGPVAFLLGWTRMKFSQFLRNSMASIAIALPVLFGVTYGLFSGLTPLRAVAAFKNVETTFLIAVIAIVLIEFFFTRAFRRMFVKPEKEEKTR